MKQLRVGVAGLGEAATEFLPGYSRHPGVQLVACADKRQSARERFAVDFGGRAYTDIAEMCADPDIDVVIVATNHEFHRDPVIWAAENKKHVVVEKPMALTLVDCDAMIEACDRNGVLLLAGHSHSYDPPIRKMHELIVQGGLGRLRMINCWNFNDFMVRPYPDDHLRQSDGVVLNQGPHHVDVVRYLAGGEMRSVRATIGRWDESRPGHGSYAAFCEFEDGTVSTLVYSGYGFFDTAELFGWYGEGGQPRQQGAATASRRNYLALAAPERTLVLNGMKERLRYGSVGLSERARMPAGWEKGGRPAVKGPLETRQPFFGLVIVSCERGEIRQSPDGLLIYDDSGKHELVIADMPDARQAEIDELHRGVTEGRALLHSGRWARATIEVCLAMQTSSATGQEIRLKHQVGVPPQWVD